MGVDAEGSAFWSGYQDDLRLIRMVYQGTDDAKQHTGYLRIVYICGNFSVQFLASE